MAFLSASRFSDAVNIEPSFQLSGLSPSAWARSGEEQPYAASSQMAALLLPLTEQIVGQGRQEISRAASGSWRRALPHGVAVAPRCSIGAGVQADSGPRWTSGLYINQCG